MTDPIIGAEIGVGANDEYGMVELRIRLADHESPTSVLVNEVVALELARLIQDAVRDLN
jgi:hypothetical protein